MARPEKIIQGRGGRRALESRTQTATLPFLLLPNDLYVHESARLRFAVTGTCMAENFAIAAQDAGHTADHYLMQSRAEDEPPSVDWSQYDAIVVHLTLRHICWSIEGRPDLFHTSHMSDDEYAAALAVADSQVQRIIRNVTAAVGTKAPVFFLAFVEPTASHQGILLNNRRKSLYHFVHTLNDYMAAALEDRQNAYFIEVNDLVRHCGDASVSDAYQLHFTHAGIANSEATGPLFTAVMKRIAHAMSILRAEAPIKLIVTDLDNTLWKGVLAEMDDFYGHEHTEGWPLGYAEALLEFKRRGGMLAISSKNDHEPTLERFRKAWGDRLKIEDFCSIQINWEPKSKGIRQILREANVLPENTLFIDDNPLEIAEVTRALPGLRTLTGEPTAWRNVILYAPQTPVASISTESAKRTEMIQAKQQRDQLVEQMDRESYLNSLELAVRFDEIKDTSHPRFTRASELINKTNQFNTTGKRWSASDFNAHFSLGGRLVTASVADKFSDNGLVAVAAIKGDEISQIVMSCRVFGLGVENALAHQVQSLVGESLSVPFVDTGKNKSCGAFLAQDAFSESAGLFILSGRVPHPRWMRKV